MWKGLLKLILLAGASSLPWLAQHTAAPTGAAEWEACLQNLNPQGYILLQSADPRQLMADAHWDLYLDSYTLRASNYTPQLWRIELHYNDVQLLLRAHRQPEFRPSLPADSQKAIALAEETVASLTAPGMTDLQKARALHDHLASTCTYSLHGAADATNMLLQRSGTCEAYSRALQLLLEIAGIPCRLVYGTVEGGIRHCWNAAFINGEWLYIDTSWDTPSTPGAAPSHLYFAVPASTLRPTHTWGDN